jgi:hypothetical protein
MQLSVTFPELVYSFTALIKSRQFCHAQKENFTKSEKYTGMDVCGKVGNGVMFFISYRNHLKHTIVYQMQQ